MGREGKGEKEAEKAEKETVINSRRSHSSDHKLDAMQCKSQGSINITLRGLSDAL